VAYQVVESVDARNVGWPQGDGESQEAQRLLRGGHDSARRSAGHHGAPTPTTRSAKRAGSPSAFRTVGASSP